MEDRSPYLLLTALVIVVAALFRTFKRRRSTRQEPLPPGPRWLPVLGNLLDFGINPHRSLARLARTHGPVMSLELGSIYIFVISSPSAAKEVLQTKEHLFGRPLPNAVKSLGHHEVSIVWSSRNQLWKYLRTLVKAQFFTAQPLNATQLLRHQKVQELVTYIRGQNGRPVDVVQASFCTLLNLISSTFLSIDMVDIKADSTQEMKDLIWGLMEESARTNISDFFPILASIDLQGRRRRFTSYLKKLFDFFDQLIQNRLAATAKEDERLNSDFLDVLLQHSREESSKLLNKRTIKSLLVDFFIAGSETTSTTLEWAMVELLRRPELMARAREEIAEVVGIEREVDESDIARLSFLQVVLKETLRLHPPVPLLLHKAEVNMEINGYRVPKNSKVLVNVWAIGRDEQIWEKPDCFWPERFLEGSKIDFRGQHFEFIPFGSGRRICPGMSLAIRMVLLMLASLIQSFEWSLPDGMAPKDLDLKEKLSLTLAMAYPLKALATPISV